MKYTFHSICSVLYKTNVINAEEGEKVYKEGRKMEYELFFCTASSKYFQYVTPQRSMATILMVKKDRNCLLEWGMLSTKSVQSTDDFVVADAAS